MERKQMNQKMTGVEGTVPSNVDWYAMVIDPDVQ